MSRKEVEANPYEHRFNVRVMPEFGFPAAVLFSDIAYWVRRNQEERTHYFEGRHWIFGGRLEFQRRHPYLTEHQVRTALRELVKAGLLDIGCFNRTAMDRTRWYTLGPSASSYLPSAAPCKNNKYASSKVRHRDNGWAALGPMEGTPGGQAIPMVDTIPLENPHQGGFTRGDDNISDSIHSFSSENPSQRDFSAREYDSHGSWENPSQRDFSQENNDSHLSQESPLLGRGLPERGNDSHEFGEGFPHREPSPIKDIPAAERDPFGEGSSRSRKVKPSSRRTSLGGEPGGRKGEETQEVFPQTTPGGTVIWARSALGDGEPLVMIETEGGGKVWTRASEIM
jgi:hypothetical protein